MTKKILIAEARFYEALTDALVEGAVAEITVAGHDYERITVPGVLEIPPVIAKAADSGKFDAFIALGVVIRGETIHYDTVCRESARGLMDVGITHRLAIGNGIQTVEDEAQAWVRCDPEQKNKGGGAARAAITLMHALGGLKAAP